MVRIRKIREWGGQLIIALRNVDSREMDIEVGDEVDIEDIQVIKQKKGKPKK